ncbi:MAG: GNAT family N-acetyltransferase [Crocinitomicaceae bacterium]
MQNITFQLIPPLEIITALPLLMLLNKNETAEVLSERLLEMSTQNYECVGIYDSEKLIGISGLWFQTRHYSGRSIEPDHVIIHEDYRNKGLGKLLFDWIDSYAKRKNCTAVELNSYVANTASHKFYYNEGFAIMGFHFVKKF